jgi:endonuclease/exonuclease/phosphatase family metal-dependent hydrolase
LTRPIHAGSGRAKRVRVATYNIHKCRGLDGRVRPERIARVLSDLDADLIALQEVVCLDGNRREDHQAQYFAEALGYHVELGENRRHKGGAYGNVLLSRFPVVRTRNYDLSVPGRERRGCLRADIRLDDGGWLHVFNLHLGTSYFERRKQARTLFQREILTGEELSGSKVVLGDFNEWTKGLASRLLHSHFHRADPRASTRRAKSYPGVLPVLQLDHIYLDRSLRLHGVTVHRSRPALLASDHLPLVAEFDLPSSSHHQRIECSPESIATFGTQASAF